MLWQRVRARRARVCWVDGQVQELVVQLLRGQDGFWTGAAARGRGACAGSEVALQLGVVMGVAALLWRRSERWGHWSPGFTRTRWWGLVLPDRGSRGGEDGDSIAADNRDGHALSQPSCLASLAGPRRNPPPEILDELRGSRPQHAGCLYRERYEAVAGSQAGVAGALARLGVAGRGPWLYSRLDQRGRRECVGAGSVPDQTLALAVRKEC